MIPGTEVPGIIGRLSRCLDQFQFFRVAGHHVSVIEENEVSTDLQGGIDGSWWWWGRPEVVDDDRCSGALLESHRIADAKAEVVGIYEVRSHGVQACAGAWSGLSSAADS